MQKTENLSARDIMRWRISQPKYSKSLAVMLRKNSCLCQYRGNISVVLLQTQHMVPEWKSVSSISGLEITGLSLIWEASTPRPHAIESCGLMQNMSGSNERKQKYKRREISPHQEGWVQGQEFSTLGSQRLWPWRSNSQGAASWLQWSAVSPTLSLGQSFCG